MVKDYAEASLVWQRLRDDEGIGASGMKAHCGLLQQDGKRVGYISYNGRVWDAYGNLLAEAAKGGKR